MFDLSGYIKKLEKQAVKPIETAIVGEIEELSPKAYTKPYINEYNTLAISFDSDPKYHWWKGGQDIVETLFELSASEDILEKYCSNWQEVKKKLQEVNI